MNLKEYAQDINEILELPRRSNVSKFQDIMDLSIEFAEEIKRVIPYVDLDDDAINAIEKGARTILGATVNTIENYNLIESFHDEMFQLTAADVSLGMKTKTIDGRMKLDLEIIILSLGIMKKVINQSAVYQEINSATKDDFAGLIALVLVR